MLPSADQCAHEVLEVIPMVMRGIRSELRIHRGGDISVPQFRTLLFLSRNENASLSEVAQHIGLTLPSMSNTIDMLVARRLVTRESHPADRRRMTLALTTPGRATLGSALKATEAYLRGLFGTLSSGERATIIQAMQTLRPLFSQPRNLVRKRER